MNTLLIGILIINCFTVMWAIGVFISLILSGKTTKNSSKTTESPFISILLAVRNEEDCIADCLNSLSNQTYEKFEILVGDDNSEDGSSKIIQTLAERNSKITYYAINSQKYDLKNKANVLEQLAEKAKGTYIVTTDADIIHDKNWLLSLLTNSHQDCDISGGPTFINAGKNYLHQLQALEWMYFMALITGGFKLFPVLIMGNNMMIKKEAFEQSGRFKEGKSSLTEDYHLFRRMIKHGFKAELIRMPEAAVFSKPLNSFRSIWEQRKRWISGSSIMPVYQKLISLNFGLFLPAMVLLGFNALTVAISFLLLILMLNFILLVLVSQHYKLKLNVKYLPVFNFYLYAFMFISIAISVLKLKSEWKGR